MSVTLKHDNGDLVVSTAGAFIYINGVEKCAQDIAESLLNNWSLEGPNPFNGSELYLIDEDPSTLSIITVEERVRVAVEDSILRLQDLQEADDFADETEVIEEIRALIVQKVGRMSYGFFLNVVTASEDYVPQNFVIGLNQQLPSSFDADAILGEFMTSANSKNAPYA